MKYKQLYAFIGMNWLQRWNEYANLRTWNIAMRAVDKIESLGYSVTISSAGCEIKDRNYPVNRYYVSLFCHTKLESVYEACLRFALTNQEIKI